jgi:hypothetical protein
MIDKWRSVVREHATALQHETGALRALLKPIFFDEAAVRQNTDNQAVDHNQAVDELFEAASFNEKAIRLAFTISESSATPLIKTERFWLSLNKAERLAERLRVEN